MNIVRVVCLAAIFSLAVAGAAVPSERAVTLPNIPSAAQKGIQSKLGECPLEGIVELTDAGELSYEVEVSRGGRNWTFTISGSGELLDEEVPLAQAPAAVQKTIRAHVGRGKIECITKVFDEDGVTYEVTVTQRGSTREFTVGADGKLLKLQVFEPDLPAVLQSAIRKAAGSDTLGDMYRVLENDEVSYEVETDGSLGGRTLTFDSAGKLILEEQAVALTNTPPAVQAVLKAETARGGKLVAMTKQIEDGEVSFEAEVLKAGKRNTLTLGTDGKLLAD